MTTNFQTMMSICHGGNCIGQVYPYGSFYGEVCSNPLIGLHFDPEFPWFVITQDSESFEKIRDLIEAALEENGKKISDLTGLKVGLPKGHIDRLAKFEEFEEIKGD